MALIAAAWMAPARGDGAVDVSASLRGLIESDWIDEDRQFAVAEGSTGAPDQAGGITTAQDAAGGCDGIKNGRWGFHTRSQEVDPWWQVDLGKEYLLDRIVVYNRTDGNTAPRTRNLQILVRKEGQKFRKVYQHGGETFYGVQEKKPLVVSLADRNISARVVRLAVPGRCSFALDEVEVYAAGREKENIALGKPADQKSTGPYSHASPSPPGRDRAAGFSLAHTREVLGRGRGLSSRLRSRVDAGLLNPLEEKLRILERRLAGLEKEKPGERERRDLYFSARRLVREIAFTNPLLDFDRILFIQRHHPGGVFHMCDQYYGFNARPGGGLFILCDPFGPSPKLINVLADSVVERGRLQGRQLEPGAFLSPELSFDGKTILFAYTEGKGKDLEWSLQSCYHIFQVQPDGSGLVQLTDGPWDDFDPCFLPGGRIVFVSERRGGYLRCGRHCPTYAMFSMASDGSDIACLSFHETHEWHPSVTNDGLIVYTRWDYVDRDTNVAHHIWTCYPDGRDPRSFHGNYPVRRENRPWMEMSIRAVPGSPKYVATAAAHHGHALGSLVLIDPRVEDDGAMSQLERLTPDVPFPEAERHLRPIRECMVYGTAWPLSEEDFLCTYGRDAKNHGIYWIDRYGNRELLYRDPNIPSMSPIPLRPRPVPPEIPERIAGKMPSPARAGEAASPATLAVVNVYNSELPWPEETRIQALRIIQVLPKTTPPPNQPRIGVADQSNARAILGTVPVEADGSVHFEAPAGRLLYFQALDERGMAIQSMRSGMYLQPGERLVCQGCHEPNHRSLPGTGAVPLALRRPPSPIQKEVVEGANPFSYVRLVQPVLDRNCVGCHQKEKALDLTGAIEGRHGWTRSYINLAGKYGFYYNVRNGSINDRIGGSRTLPGKFGARASKLMEYLDERHHGVKLSREDLHRLVLWLDGNSEFYGSYEDTAAQARGEIVYPTLY